MLQKLKRFLIPLLILALAVAFFVYMKSSKPEQKSVEIKEKVWMVDTLQAKFEDLAPVQTLYGKVESHSMVSLAAPVTGVVEKVTVREGQVVNKGDGIISLSDADLIVPLQQAKAELSDAQAQFQLQKMTNVANQKHLEHEVKVLALKKTAVKRSQQLMAKNLASQSTLDLASEALVRQEYVVVSAELAVQQNGLKLSQAKARVLKAQAALTQAKTNLQRGQVVAPYHARIAQVNVSEGSRINAGTVMVTYYALDSLELRAKLPVGQLKAVQQALTNKQALQAFYVDGANDESLELLRLAGEASTSGVDAFFRLPKTLLQSRPGELMEVNLKGVAKRNVVAVPYSAVFGSNRVYIVEEQRLQARTVELVGEVMRNGKLWALIKPDFSEGAKICVTHLPNAVTGLKVTEVVK